MSDLQPKKSFPSLMKYGLAVCLAGFATLHAAHAQTAVQAGPEAGAQGTALEEVVVTARRRAEKLQDVPLAVSAFSAQQLQQLGVVDQTTLSEFTPGFQFTDYTEGRVTRGAFRSLVFRGLALSNNTGVTSAGLVFLDGAPVVAGDVLITDALERVEVLKGPQNVYFGRSTFSGAINYVTRNPGNDYQGSLQVEVGNHDEYKVDGHIEGAIVAGKATFSLDGELYNKDGEYTDAAMPSVKLGARATKSIAGTVYLTPTDELSVKVYANYYTFDDGPTAQGFFPSSQSNCNPGGQPGPAFYHCGEIGAMPAKFIAESLYFTAGEQLGLGNPPGYAGKILLGAYDCNKIGACDDTTATHSIIKYDFDNGMKLESITAYHLRNAEDVDNLVQVDASTLTNPLFGNPAYPTAPPVTTYDYNIMNKTKDISTELRLSSADDQALRWTIGANYVTTTDLNQLFFYTPAGGPAPCPLCTYGSTGAETYGVFGGVYYEPIEGLTLSAEARYQSDDRTDISATDGEVFNKTFRSWSPRASIDYKLNDSLNLYGSYAAGVRPGGFNAVLAGLPNVILSQIAAQTGGTSIAYKEEKLSTYEIGLKGAFFDNTVRTNVSVYKGKLTNEQSSEVAFTTTIGVASGGEYTVVSNQGVVNIDGVEADAEWKVSRILKLSGTVGYNHTDIVESNCYTCFLITGNANINGKALPGAPELSYSFAADATDSLTATLNWFAHADMAYKGNIWIDQPNLVGTGSSIKVNLQAGVENDTYEFGAFVNNLTDDRTILGGTPGTDFTSFSIYGLRTGLPETREYGLRFKYKFNAGSMETETKAAAYVPPPVMAPKPAAVAKSYQVFFDFNKSDLTPEAVKVVDQAAANAAPAKVTRIDVTGHTDTVGSDAYNMRLSRRRAESVAAELEARGIPASEIAIFAKGKKDLLVPTADGVREPQNRRVQIVYEDGATS
jgi:iron complex outermembrane receptor protein